MNRPLSTAAICLSLLISASSTRAQFQAPLQTEPTLKQITAEQDWIARSPQSPRWLLDGSAIMFSQRRQGPAARDFNDKYWLIVEPQITTIPIPITPELPGPFFTASGDWDASVTRRLVQHNGDLFLYNKQANTTTQLTRTNDYESGAMFMADNTRIAFTRNANWIIRSESDAGSIELQPADIRFEDEPKDPADARQKAIDKRDELQRQQRELFDIINLQDERDAIRQDDRHAWRDTDPTDVPGPFYMGKDNRSQGSWLSPSGKFILVASTPKERDDARNDIMPNYISEDGYVSTRSVRTKVGLESRSPVTMRLLDLQSERIIELPFDDLPTIKENPLAWLKEKTLTNDKAAESESNDSNPNELKEETKEEETKEADPKPRSASLLGARWSDSGRFAAFMLRSNDNKDRWIVLIDTDQEVITPTCIHHLRDDAWINWSFNEFGFIPAPADGADTLWYLSEESNYSHLYTYNPTTETTTQETDGNFEVQDITFTNDGSRAYMRTNQTHPGIQELNQLDLATSALTQITHMRGTVENYSLSPDESRVLFTYSNLNSPPELFLLDLHSKDALPSQLTNTITDEFNAANFQTPQIIAVPSTHTDQPIYTRLYLPDATKYPGPRPLVVFSHGAGYLQHANYQWSYYSREHMFHTILTNEGFIVVAPDFRASSGYGRDWRTAIYRQMGYKELEDFKDTIDYAVKNHNADPTRVGIYGGSYGGFMTLMAMFLEPETYKCGAALRSVTDWRHYNHGYTANILNTPDIDPDAFDISSPINFADGLQGHLLMLHGLQDDNVVAQDIIRLSQRLIELEKENWELALAPIEPHAYHEPSSWLDQMRRIHKLFSSELNQNNP